MLTKFKFDGMYVCTCVCMYLHTIVAAPSITYYSPAIVAFEGNEVDLICNATNDVDAINPMQVSWYYRAMLIKPDGKYVVINNIRNNATGQIHSVLSFNPVNYTNDGVYTCQAFNQPLSFTENNIKLTVECELAIWS